MILFTAIICLLSCGEGKKTEFVQSEAMQNLFLLKNPPNDDSLTKQVIKDFLLKSPDFYNKKDYYNAIFYKYTSNTSYFIDNKEYDGFGAKSLSTCNNDHLGSFIISKCERDSTKLVGELYYDGLNGSDYGQKEIDTLIYKCK